jgi:hypothetical protein
MVMATAEEAVAYVAIRKEEAVAETDRCQGVVSEAADSGLLSPAGREGLRNLATLIRCGYHGGELLSLRVESIRAAGRYRAE